MTKVINKLFYDKKLNRKLSNAGLKNSLKFTWEKIANKYIQIFRSI